MTDTFLLIGLVVVVTIALCFEHLLLRRRRDTAQRVIARGLDAHLASESWAYGLALEVARAGLPTAAPELELAPLLSMLCATPDMTDPSHREVTGAGTVGELGSPRRGSNHAVIGTGSISTGSAADKACGAVRGRISSRTLVALECRVCGADLMPVLAAALVGGCPACRGAAAMTTVAGRRSA
jgi:hypothetical protein